MPSLAVTTRKPSDSRLARSSITMAGSSSATRMVSACARLGAAAGFAAGVTDYLTKPFRPAHVRARVRAWLLRRSAGIANP